jgi:nitrate/nitrite-specific signal transduction histidine kinase
MSMTKYPRKMRNFLLDKRFQLKYTLAVVVLSAIISTVLGVLIYQEQQKVLQAERDNSKLVALDDPELDAAMQQVLAESDRKIQERSHRMLFSLVGFLGLLVLLLTLVGIVATHKIAGPAYAMRRTLSAIADGHLPEVRALRKGDELRAVAEELRRMADTLRQREQSEVQRLSQALAAESLPETVRAELTALLEEKKKRLE